MSRAPVTNIPIYAAVMAKLLLYPHLLVSVSEIKLQKIYDNVSPDDSLANADNLPINFGDHLRVFVEVGRGRGGGIFISPWKSIRAK